MSWRECTACRARGYAAEFFHATAVRVNRLTRAQVFWVRTERRRRLGDGGDRVLTDVGLNLTSSRLSRMTTRSSSVALSNRPVCSANAPAMIWTSVPFSNGIFLPSGPTRVRPRFEFPPPRPAARAPAPRRRSDARSLPRIDRSPALLGWRGRYERWSETAAGAANSFARMYDSPQVTRQIDPGPDVRDGTWPWFPHSAASQLRTTAVRSGQSSASLG